MLFAYDPNLLILTQRGQKTRTTEIGYSENSHTRGSARLWVILSMLEKNVLSIICKGTKTGKTIGSAFTFFVTLHVSGRKVVSVPL